MIFEEETKVRSLDPWYQMLSLTMRKELMQSTCEEIGAFMKDKNWSEAAKAVVKLKYLEGVDSAAKSWTPH